MSVITPTPPGPRLACSVVCDPQRLEQLAPAWLELLGRSGSNEPVLTPLWLLTWWRVFGPEGGRRLRIACFHQGGRLVGLAPFLRRRHWYRPGIPFRRLEPLGTGERSADAIYPEYLNVIAEQGAEAEVAAALAAALTGGALGGWDEWLLPLAAGDSPLLPQLAAAFGARGLTCDCQATASAPYIPLPATWDDYLQKLSSSRRHFVRQSLRRFEEWAGAAGRLHAVSGPADLEEGKRALTALHQNRWGAREGKFGSPRFAAFHDRILPGLLEAGALELLWLSVRGEPVAAVYNIVWNGKVYFYQNGRKPDVPHGQRPGIVLHAHAIRRAIAAGRREYDFLSGGEHYKGQLALASRPVVQLRVTRRSPLERLRTVAEGGIGWARALRNRLRSSRGGPAEGGEPPPHRPR
jgi:CelD/BcsL family acetyltransferase involved in cellulose biosynthesis